MNSGIRQFHRWTSIVFIATVVINTVALVMGKQATWIGLMALFPLILLMITGLYLFVLPYLSGGRGARGAGDAA